MSVAPTFHRVSPRASTKRCRATATLPPVKRSGYASTPLTRFCAICSPVRRRDAVSGSTCRRSTWPPTAGGNDFGFDHIFERQVEALARSGDLLIIHSTSGNSPNVILAAEAAKKKGVRVLSFSARDGGKLRAQSDHTIVIPNERT